MKLQMTKYTEKYHKIHPADFTDITPAYIREFIHNTPCIHCGEIFNRYKKLNAKIMYTELSNGKFIWWHIQSSCTPDPIEELEL